MNRVGDENPSPLQDLLVFQFLSVPVFASDSGGSIVFWNNALQELTGRSAASVLGTKANLVFGGSDVESLLLLVMADRQKRELPVGVQGRRLRLQSDYFPNHGSALVISSLVDLKDGAPVRELEASALENEKARRHFALEIDRIVSGFQSDRGLALSAPADSPYHGHATKLNQLLQALACEQTRTEEVLLKLCNGEIPSKIAELSRGNSPNLASSLNRLIDRFAGLNESVELLERMAQNDFDLAVSENHPGIFGQLPKKLNVVRERLLGLVDYIERVSRGDMAALQKLKQVNEGKGRRSDKDRIVPALILTMQTLQELSVSIVELSDSVKQGKLSARINPSAFSGVYGNLVQGANESIESVVGPLQVAASCINKISKGEIPPKITERYNGDFDTIKSNINDCIDGLGGLVEANQVLQRMALNDYELSIKGSYVGIFAEVAHAVNDVRTRLLTVVQISEEMAQGDLHSLSSLKAINGGKGYRCENDRLAPALTLMMQTIKDLVDQVVELGHAAHEGLLSHRGDVQHFRGDYRQVLEGVNSTLDSVVEPLKVAALYVDRIAKGDIPPEINTEYRGDFSEIRNNLNNCVRIMNTLVSQSSLIADATAQGDLTVRSETSSLPGKWAHIVESMNQMADQLHDSIVQVAGASEQVSAASEEIASGSQSVAQGASEQASALEETSASMEEMLAMTKHTTENTRQARILAEATTQLAHRGGKAMVSMLDSMSKIHQATEGTSGIIREINEIAFQTNLLALNAAVEAARAGDAGRGFAVVAEEVRHLAQRAKEAAKQTDQLINQSLKLTEGGQEISQQVNGNLTEIIVSIQKVSGIVSEIAVASEQQSRGIAQVNSALCNMDKVTQLNAANSEESSAAAEELSSQARELTSMVGQFVLRREAGTQRRRQPHKPVASPQRVQGPRRVASAIGKAKPAPFAKSGLLFDDDDPECSDF